MFKSPNKNELEKNLGVAQDLVPKPTSYRPFKSIKDVKAKLNKRMSPEEVAEWVNDFQSVMSELVKQNIVAAQKLIDSARLSESVFQTPFGTYNMVTGRGKPRLKQLVKTRTKDMPEDDEARAIHRVSLEIDKHRQQLEHWSLWALLNEPIVEEALQSDIKMQLNVMTPGKFGDVGCPSLRSAVSYVFGNLKKEYRSVAHVTCLVTTDRGQQNLFQWLSTVYALQKRGKVLGVNFEKPAKELMQDDKLAEIYKRHIPKPKEVHHEYFEKFLSEKEKQWLQTHGLAGMELEEVFKQMRQGGQKHQTSEQLSLLFQQTAVKKVWSSQSEAIRQRVGEKPKKQPRPTDAEREKAKKQRKQEEKKRQRESKKKDAGDTPRKPKCDKCGKNHDPPCDPNYAEKLKQRRAAAKGQGAGQVHADRRKQVPGANNGLKKMCAQVEEEKGNRIEKDLSAFAACQDQVDDSRTIYDTVGHLGKGQNPAYKVLTATVAARGKQGGCYGIQVGLDSDSNVSLISKETLKKCKLVKQEEAFERMDQHLKDYSRSVPDTLKTLSGFEKLGRMKFIEIIPTRKGDQKSDGIVVPVFEADKSNLLKDTDGLLSYYVSRKVFGDAFSAQGEETTPDSPSMGEEGN